MPYQGFRFRGDDYTQYSDRMQNSRPVASQFKADVKPKITSPQCAERAVNPFSSSFKQRLQQAGGNLKRVERAITNGGRSFGNDRSDNLFSDQSAKQTLASSTLLPIGLSLYEGCTVEHQRFGVGTILKIEGNGENAKATVLFNNVGSKQLLLKFARLKVIK